MHARKSGSILEGWRMVLWRSISESAFRRDFEPVGPSLTRARETLAQLKADVTYAAFTTAYTYFPDKKTPKPGLLFADDSSFVWYFENVPINGRPTIYSGNLSRNDIVGCEHRKARDLDLGLLYGLTILAESDNQDPYVNLAGQQLGGHFETYALTRDTRSEILLGVLGSVRVRRL